MNPVFLKIPATLMGWRREERSVSYINLQGLRCVSCSQGQSYEDDEKGKGWRHYPAVKLVYKNHCETLRFSTDEQAFNACAFVEEGLRECGIKIKEYSEKQIDELQKGSYLPKGTY